MSKKYNIDELLSESFENFSPEAPDVWQGIQQGIQAAQASSAAGSAMVAAKGSALVVKLIAAVAVVSAIAVGYVLYTPTDAVSTTTPKEDMQTVSPSSDIPETVELKSDEVLAALPVPEPVKQQVTPKAPAVAPVSKVTPTQVVESSGPQVVESNTQDVLPKQTNAEVLVEHKPSNTSTTQPQPPVTESKQTQPTKEDKVPPAYNPKAEEVVFEEPTIPGSFSPDGDGVNDVYRVVIDKEKFFLLTIYDKQGKKVFESNSKDNTWDGKDFQNGNPCLPGTYTWIFRYQFKDAENEKIIKGSLKLF